MLKKIRIHLLIGGGFIIFGFLLLMDILVLEGVKEVAVGTLLLIVGAAYIIILTLYHSGKTQALLRGTASIAKSTASAVKDSTNRGNKKTYEELLLLKKLLDEGMLSQEDFEKKSAELKGRII